ncbi:MAG: DUF3078 domain-containing protein [Bacteroidota bacterium]|nr:DUF3078 domain-containing protein [Bacteroidota bacterium]
MKKIILTTAIICIAIVGFSQTTEKEKKLKTMSKDTIDGWKYGGTIAINLTQVSLTNWAAGGQNSISASELLSLFANYKKGKSTWENYLDLSYGSIKQGKNANWWKTDDKIDFTSKFGQKAFSNWYYAGLLNFKTQMAAGYNYPDDSNKISDFLAPGYLIGAIGMDYKPSDNFTAFIAPLTSKVTFVNDQSLANAGAFGVEPATYDTAGNLLTSGKKNLSEFGGYIRLFYKTDLMKNISMQSKLDLFSNYIDNPQYIDVNWEVLISMKINKFISATLSTQLLYDHDIDIAVDTNGDGVTDETGPRIQFKEVLGVGFSYKF